MKRRIFLVEDDLNFGMVLKSYLEINEYEVTWVDDGLKAIDIFRSGEFDITILDVMLPNIDGFTIGKSIRDINRDIPMIYLTARSLKEDVLKGYEIGADDYVTKPFDTDVLIAKIQAILSRKGTKAPTPNTLTIGKFNFNTERRVISHGDNSKQISPKEAALLELLIEHKNRLLTREVALKKIWGEDDYFTARSMDVFITKLRKYLKEDEDITIKNIHGSGFILTDIAE